MLTKLQTIYAHDFTRIEFKTRTWKFVFLNVALFAFPLILGQPQLLIGSIVNFGLIYMALNFKKNELLPAIFLPSIATFLHGVIWGPLTVYLAILMPVIWAGNALLVLGIRYLALKKCNLPLNLGLAVIAKTALLFVVTAIIVQAFNFPQVLLTMMGSLQLFTAVIAGVVYLVLIKFHGNPQTSRAR